MRGDGYTYRRGARWWIGYYKEGEVLCREPAKISDDVGVLHPAKNEKEAWRFLRARIKALRGGHFLGPQEERLTVSDLLKTLEERATQRDLRSKAKIKSHAKAVRTFFGATRAVDVTSEDIDRFKQERRAAGRAAATINRGLEVLRQAYRLAVKKKRLSVGQVPEIELLAVDNVRSGFFDLAEMSALLPRIADVDVRDFVECGASGRASVRAKSPR